MTPCPRCGSEWLLVQVLFDDEGSITFYDLNAECNTCSYPMKAPTPIQPIHLSIVK